MRSDLSEVVEDVKQENESISQCFLFCSKPESELRVWRSEFYWALLKFSDWNFALYDSKNLRRNRHLISQFITKGQTPFL